MQGLAVFDMDRTLLDGRVVGALGEALGFKPQVERLSAERNAGKLTQAEVTRGIAKLLKGTTPRRFDELVAPIPLTRGAEAAVRRLREAGVALAICSDSYSRATAPLGKRLGIPRWAANELEVRDGAFTGGLVPWGPALSLGPSSDILDKRDALPLLARAAGVPLERTAVIGDGDQDALAMGLVGLGISFQGTPKARAAADHHLEGDLEPSAKLILDWLRAPPAPGGKA